MGLGTERVPAELPSKLGESLPLVEGAEAPGRGAAKMGLWVCSSGKHSAPEAQRPGPLVGESLGLCVLPTSSHYFCHHMCGVRMMLGTDTWPHCHPHPPASQPGPTASRCPRTGRAVPASPPCSESSVETAEPVLSVRTRSRLCTDSCSRRLFRKRCSRCSCSLMLSARRSCSSSFWGRVGGCEPGGAPLPHWGMEAWAESLSLTWPGPKATGSPGPMGPKGWLYPHLTLLGCYTR